MTSSAAPDETPETTGQSGQSDQSDQSADQAERALPSLDELESMADTLSKGIQAHLADLRRHGKPPG
ncbi:hypothetical protein ABZS71_10310 [Streptomyces sp. NPDC005393]|uniref:hypothetical protein n=1 Tax=Streptomyces sp. NPDC005393 TaxID=3157041 RepID=UPI0033A80A14